jgi:hypothetical protein
MSRRSTNSVGVTGLSVGQSLKNDHESWTRIERQYALRAGRTRLASIFASSLAVSDKDTQSLTLRQERSEVETPSTQVSERKTLEGCEASAARRWATILGGHANA